MDYTSFGRDHHLDIIIMDRVALVKMDRPETSNTVNPAMHLGLERLFYDLGIDPDVGAIVLTGAGEDFCVGGSVKGQYEAALHGTRKIASSMRSAKFIVHGLANCEAPIIAAVNGRANQLGATIALMCDVIYMAEDASIADTHVKTGLVAGDGGAVIWPLLIGPHRAKEYLMTGRPIDAATADKLGLVNHVVQRTNCWMRPWLLPGNWLTALDWRSGGRRWL